MMDQTASPFLPLLWQSLEKPIPLWAHFSHPGGVSASLGGRGRAEGTAPRGRARGLLA